MLFKKEMIEQILAGKKTMTRRIVKQEEYFDNELSRIPLEKQAVIKCFENKLGRIKWQVGRKYSVCLGRGKPQVWYCPFCDSWLSGVIKGNILEGEIHFGRFHEHIHKWKPLFIELVAIRKEKLLDISEEDAKREGFKGINEFLNKFSEINQVSCVGNNPDVWVLEFKVV
jgi:hypothetical protein